VRLGGRRIAVERPDEERARLVVLPLLQRNGAEVLERHRVGRAQFEDAPESGCCLVHAARSRLRDAEGVQGVEIGEVARHSVPENRYSLAPMSTFGEVGPQLGSDGHAVHTRRERRAQRRDGGRRIAQLPLQHREMRVRDLHGGMGREHPLVDRHRLRRPPALVEIDGAMDVLVDPDEPLRIVSLGVPRFGRRVPAHVPERPQAVRRFGVGGTSVGPSGACRDSAQREIEDALPIRRPTDEIGSLSRIRRQVIEFGNRQIDVLLASDDDAAKGRPPAVQRRGHRLEIRRRSVARPGVLSREKRSARQVPG
jgi:hypothetical protein